MYSCETFSVWFLTKLLWALLFLLLIRLSLKHGCFIIGCAERNDHVPTRRMAIANGTCVTFCNQPKAHYLATPRESRRYTCRCYQPFGGCRHLATSRESKAHFGLPWVHLWDNRGKCYMNRKRIQCLSNASQHVPIYLQPFLKYSDISVGSDWFSTVNGMNQRFYHILLSLGTPLEQSR